MQGGSLAGRARQSSSSSLPGPTPSLHGTAGGLFGGFCCLCPACHLNPTSPHPPPTYTRRLVVAEHGRVRGEEEMKAEILARGPISCGIDATEGLDKYRVGRWSLLLCAWVGGWVSFPPAHV